MLFCTASMPAMLAITKHGVCVGVITPCLVSFIMADMEAVQSCISTFLTSLSLFSPYAWDHAYMISAMKGEG